MNSEKTESASVDALIVRTEGVLGGRPRIRDHRVSVQRIAGWWQLGYSIDEILAEHAHLQPAEVHAALAFYHLNRAEIDGYIAEERAASVSSNPSSSVA